MNLLQFLPAWVLRLSVWDLLGVVAYTQAFALLESLLLWLVVMLVGIVLPAKLVANRFLVLGSALFFLHSIWVIIIQYIYDALRSGGLIQFLLLGSVYAFSVAVTFFLVTRSDKLAASIRALIERLAVLSFIYIFVDLLSVFVVILRNL